MTSVDGGIRAPDRLHQTEISDSFSTKLGLTKVHDGHLRDYLPVASNLSLYPDRTCCCRLVLVPTLPQGYISTYRTSWASQITVWL